MKRKKKKLWILGAFVSLTAALTAWIAWENTALETTEYTVTSARLPAAFDGYRIAQVSDLHNCCLDEGNGKLLEMLRQAQPDLIAITGDMVDRRKLDVQLALDFVREAMKIAPCYYVMGNHEGKLDTQVRLDLEEEMVQMGVVILHDRTVLLEKDTECIRIAGIDDPIYAKKHGGIGKTMDPELLRGLAAGGEYTVLLSHRPEYFDAYAQAELDLVLSGHMHGGQFRIPCLGGLYCPSHGFFPPYDAGEFSRDGTVMLVSRGIGNSVFPFRLNNRPELVVAQLKRSE